MAATRIIRCNRAYAAQILDILNEAIVTSTALYDYQPRTPEMMSQWFAAKEAKGYPVVGVVDAAGTLLAFGSYGPFRAFPAYKYTVEHSLYTHKDHRGQGHGRTILEALIAEAGRQDYHVLMAAIDSANTASIRLHEKAGFQSCGLVRQAGFKFGRWLDLALLQLILRTPSTPVDG